MGGEDKGAGGGGLLVEEGLSGIVSDEGTL